MCREQQYVVIQGSLWLPLPAAQIGGVFTEREREKTLCSRRKVLTVINLSAAHIGIWACIAVPTTHCVTDAIGPAVRAWALSRGSCPSRYSSVSAGAARARLALDNLSFYLCPAKQEATNAFRTDCGRYGNEWNRGI